MHEQVNHKLMWITPDGVHTNTVEAFHSRLRRESRVRGTKLGRTNAKRDARIAAMTMVCRLKVGGDFLKHFWEMVRRYAKHMNIRGEEEEQEEEENFSKNKPIYS